MNKKKIMILVVVGSLWSAVGFSFDIKIASLAPEGSTWMKELRAIDADLKKETGGQVTLQIYPGGSMGDEQDVLRKMQSGQLHAAGVTGRGLGMILPEVRVMELPFLYRDYRDVTKVRDSLSPRFEAGMKKKGFVILGWTENGFVYIFSQKPIASQADLKKEKMWLWIGDPLVAKMYEIFGITPVPLAVPDVLTSLQTHLVNAAYAPPLAAAAMQWFTATSCVTDLPLAYATGAIIMTQDAWNKVPEAQRGVVLKIFKTHAKTLNDLVQKDNEAALTTLIAAGMKKVSVSSEEATGIRNQSLKVWEALAGSLYPKDLLESVEKTLKQ